MYLTDRHTGDTNPLLQNLEPDHKLYSAANVELPSQTTTHELRHGIPEHAGVGANLARFFLEFCYVDDLRGESVSTVII